MIFSLEALHAEQGDCFLLHFGDATDPGVLLVDGGPGRDVYDTRLKPRLSALKAHFGSLDLPLVVCSHIDDDHIGGVLALVQDVDVGGLEVGVDCLWHNRPLDLVGESNKQKLATVLRHDEYAERYANAAMKHLAAQHGDVDPNLIYIVASVDQGDDLYADAKQAGIAINCCFNGGLVMAPTPTTGYAAIDVGELEILVLGPDAARIDALRKLWAKETKGRSVEAIYADSLRIASLVAADTDASVTNLSSIVFLAELDGHSILMPGDARGDYIIEGLDRAGRLSGGSTHVDVLKLQHHGSARNVDERFFATVTADDYVISANGEYGHPDLATFDALVDARGEQGYRVWMTNGAPGTALAPTVAALRAEYPKLALNVRPAADPSLHINVADPIGY